MSLKKRLLNNGIASVFQKSVRVLEQLILVPFFISAWGAAYYGEWITLTIIPTVIGFSDMGFGTAAANSFVLSYASDKKQEAANISKTGMYIITVMIGIAMLLSIVTIYFLNYFEVFEKSLIHKTDAIIAVSILILARLLNFYSQLFQAYYRSAQKAAMSMNLLSIYAALNLGAGLFVLLLGYGVVQFALSQLLVVLAFNFFYWIKGKQVLGLFKTHKGKRDRLIQKNITKKGLGYLMSPVWQAIYFQGTTFIVRIVLGPEAVAIFNTVRTLSRSLNQLFFMIKAAIFPELQFEIGKQNWLTAQKIYRVAMLSVFLMSSIGFILLSIFGLWFYRIWTNNELEVPKAVWYLFISGMLLNSLWWTTEMVFGAVNKPRKMAMYGIGASLFSVVLTYVFSKQYGLVGAAMGAVSLEIILVFLVIPAGSKLMGMSPKELLLNGYDDFRFLYKQLKNKLNSLKA
ncbi:lipopolysaccharide biosynthesis protein [Zobellia barbeyronii]|uniref:Polysaccharide biosynthesis C-terminal domain-containing protein n=1 Tax=Zobellia barbeyronii TaxID=2748009 RepID=A0ABS5W9S7_9FLAO|nr:polysaccharide biosynthesis C-terminal domain-containing protein [Zobellia barbeyronii]MBT2159746.1 polysaccharide biosynthesis C-terminal domain-containing protein [Zobellia barbeyronii]